ncbi:hypothetical protein MHI11_20760 [Bacillus sp. FSL K6-3312]
MTLSKRLSASFVNKHWYERWPSFFIRVLIDFPGARAAVLFGFLN